MLAVGEVDRFLGGVADAQLPERILEAHQPEADRAVAQLEFRASGIG